MLDTEALHRIGIDTEEGIAYCADDPEFYVRLQVCFPEGILILIHWLSEKRMIRMFPE